VNCTDGSTTRLALSSYLHLTQRSRAKGAFKKQPHPLSGGHQCSHDNSYGSLVHPGKAGYTVSADLADFAAQDITLSTLGALATWHSACCAIQKPSTVRRVNKSCDCERTTHLSRSLFPFRSTHTAVSVLGRLRGCMVPEPVVRFSTRTCRQNEINERFFFQPDTRQGLRPFAASTAYRIKNTLHDVIGCFWGLVEGAD
jgi:hypothetical protein